MEKSYKSIAIDLIKQKKLDADWKAILQINFTGNLDKDGHTTMFFITEKANKTILNTVGEFLQHPDKMFESIMKVALEAWNFVNSVSKGKSIPNASLDARSNLVYNKIKTKPSLLFQE